MAPHLDHPTQVLLWHLLVGYLVTVTFDWNWIPLTSEEAKRGTSLDQLRSKLFDLEAFMQDWSKDFKE